MLSDDRLAELIDEASFGCSEHSARATSAKREQADLVSALTELAEARKLLREALPHLHHTGATHHQQCACSVKRRIEAIIQAKGVPAP